jgi:hypothetical protein
MIACLDSNHVYLLESDVRSKENAFTAHLCLFAHDYYVNVKLSFISKRSDTLIKIRRESIALVMRLDGMKKGKLKSLCKY